ncbi:hybrid sensor histidine kinase/response regulator [Aliikangiella sp. IMCC44653]
MYIQLSQSSNHFIIKVIDTGIGISDAQLASIFDEFVQLNNPERDRKKGLGLGLSIVKRMANLLDYSIQVTSKENQGSCFSLAIPKTNQTNSAPAITKTPAKPKSFPVNLKVLLIDDELEVRNGIKALLSLWGCQVESFESEKSALEFLKASNFKPNVILADYRLQNSKTGIQAIDHINAYLKTKLPAAIITGDTAPDRLLEARKSGYLLMHKPVSPIVLKEFLSQLKSEQ